MSAAQSAEGINRYLEVDFLGGKVVPNYPNYPKTGVLYGAGVLIGKADNSLSGINDFFNFPETGLHLGGYSFGNDTIFGKGITIIPTAEIAMWGSWTIRLGVGAAYFTRSFRDNRLNKAVGSHLNWSFQAFVNKHYSISDFIRLKLGGGFLHASNGHTQLPNFGFNAAVLNATIRRYGKPYVPPDRSIEQEYPKKQTLNLTYGRGFHEFGGTSGPVGRPKYTIQGASITYGITFREVFKVDMGLGYRYYESFADSIKANPGLREDGIHPHNLFFLLGSEFLFGRLGFKVDGGLNIIKPFFPHFASGFGERNDWSYPLKRVILNRLGLNYYLIRPGKDPGHNIAIGAFVNANFGQADFMEFTLRYIPRLR